MVWKGLALDRVSISDPMTRAALWGFVEEVDFAFRKKSCDADFSETVHLLVADVQALVEPPMQP
jgi:hypothetical protein